MGHEFDEDAFFWHCHFDAAEWNWWKHHTYEGKASDAEQPECIAARSDIPTTFISIDDDCDW